MTIIKNTMDKLTLRQPASAEVEAAYALVVRCETEALGEGLMEWDEHRQDWLDNPAENRWVVSTPDNQIVGYAILFEFAPGDFMLYAYVHSDFAGRGIGTQLLQAGEQRARDMMPPTGAVYLRSVNAGDTPAAAALFTGQGFHIKTHVFVLTLEMSAPPPVAQWPDGLPCRLARIPADNRAVWELVEAGYVVPGRVRREFETWEPRVMNAPGFDPTLFWVVENPAGELVGALYASNNETYTDVYQMVTREDFRRRGIGTNLLYTLFNAAWERGWRRVMLNVSADNPTNALSLYQKAGLKVQHHFVKWEKGLREA